jgi:hypothetical protein
MSSPRPTRGNPSMGDILRTTGVIGLILLGLYGFGRFFTQEPDSPVKAIDYAAVVEQARPAADFALLAPKALPAGWQATSARFEPGSWHLGVLTDDQEYIGLEQLGADVDRAVDRFAQGSRAAGTADVGGETWTVRRGPQDRLTYVRRDGGLTTLVNGTAARSVIEDYVASLSAS